MRESQDSPSNRTISSEPPESSESVTFLGDFSKKLAANTFFNLLGRSWSVLVTLLLTPYILSHLSKEDFGVWVLLGVFTSSFSLIDLGLGSSFVKFISAYFTVGDYDSINKAVFSGLMFYSGLGVLLIAIGLGTERLLFSVFNVPDAHDAYLLALIACAVTNIGSMFLSVFRGIQRMDKSNYIEMRMMILSAVGTVVFLESGFGLYGLAVNAMIVSFVSLSVGWWAVKRAIPEFSIHPHFDKRLFSDMFGYGLKIWVSRVGTLISLQIDKLIVSAFQGIGAVSFYEVSARLAALMRNIPLTMISALIPATSELDARNDRTKILQTYLLASRYVAMITVALVACVILEADSVLRLWLGGGFEQSVILVRILAIGYGANVLGGTASQTGAGIGHPEFDMRGTTLLVVLNPILSFFLIQEFGTPGAAAGTCLALISAAVYLLVTFHRNWVETSVWTTFQEIHLRPLTSGFLALLAVTGLHHAVPDIDRLNQFWYLIPAKIALDCSLFGLLYFSFLIALKQVTAVDRQNFFGLMAFGLEFLRHPFRERVKIYR